MKRRTPWVIALSMACIAFFVVLGRTINWREYAYGSYINSVAEDAMILLREDPLASQEATQRAVRIVAAAADAGRYDAPQGGYALAVQYQREGQQERAEALLRQVIADRPQWSWPYALLGSILARTSPERLEEAEAILREAIVLEPDWARPYNTLGVILRLMERYDKAEEFARYAVELAPDDVAAHNNYANLMLVMGRYEEAEIHYAEALRIEAHNPKPLYNLACLYSVTGREREALEYLDEAIYLSDSLRNDAALDPYLVHLRYLPEFNALIYGSHYEDMAPSEVDSVPEQAAEEGEPRSSNARPEQQKSGSGFNE